MGKIVAGFVGTAAAVAALTASIVTVTPVRASAQGEACVGRSLPVCKSVKSCVQVNDGPWTCSENFYYYADAQ